MRVRERESRDIIMSGDKVLDMVASHFDELSKTLSNMAQALRRVRSGVRSLRFFFNFEISTKKRFDVVLFLILCKFRDCFFSMYDS